MQKFKLCSESFGSGSLKWILFGILFVWNPDEVSRQKASEIMNNEGNVKHTLVLCMSVASVVA